MKYSSPRIHSLETHSVSGYCGTGSGASTSGCTAGPAVGNYCAAGPNANPQSCTDGGTASGCAVGTTPTTNWPTRCVTGNTPA